MPQGDTDNPPVRGPIGSLAAALYRLGINHRNRRFDRRKGVVTFDRPVISVGNLSVGGTGKTPMVLHLCRVLMAAGHVPCVAMRGYGSKPGEGLESDEAQVYRRALHLPIVAQPDRTLGLIQLFGSEQGHRVDCVILDDGFQHRQIARQLDIVLIDATRTPFQDKLLPAGFLREPVSSLRRAGAIVITHAEAAAPPDVTALQVQLHELSPQATVAVSRHEWGGLTLSTESGEREEPVSWLSGRRVYAACAIGNPRPFIRHAEQACAGSLAGTLILRDHAEFELDIVQRIVNDLTSTRADVLLVTEKDWSKLKKLPEGTWPCPIARPRLELGFDKGGEALAAAVIQCVQTFDDSDE